MRFRLTEYEGSGFVTFDLLPDGNKANALKLNWELTTEEPPVWPEYKRIERKDNLWQSSCLELFMGSPESRAYVELNVSPSGAWNAYRFDDYRSGMTRAEDIQIQEVQSHPQALSAVVLFPKLTLPILLGPAAVIETRSSNLLYFALGHEDQPDFHNIALYERVDHLR